jgi:Na+/H+ antiporter NhaD/arsenite permease-like protein
MDFLDFYWFQSKISLGTLSIIGILIALLTLLLQFRKMNKQVTIPREMIKVSYTPLTLFVLSVLALAFIPWKHLGSWNHPGLIGLLLGVLSLAAGRNRLKAMLKEFDWNSIFFLIGIFVVVATVDNVGLLRDFSVWLGNSSLGSPSVYMAIFIWISVALSSFIDNVPYTMLMIPVCAQVALTLGVNPFPFYFGMLVGTGIGGNITPVGATANVLACGMLEKYGYKVELGKYLALAVPFSVSAVIVIHILLELVWL